jgi:hypothetical protein
MSQRSLAFAFLLVVLLSTSRVTAQNIQADQQNYCAYLTEQAKAQGDLLRTPAAFAGFTQPETGLPTQLIFGAQLSLSNLKKAGITLDAARNNCELYKASTGVQMTVQYALQGIEKDALGHRLTLIDDAAKSLDGLIDKTQKMVDAQNMTRPMLISLISNRLKLDSDRADTQSRIAALYVPPLPDQPIKAQVAAKQSSDIAEQTSLARLARQNNWDVALSVGTHQQINPPSGGLEPYGEVSVSYNLASHAINKHLDSSVVAYGNWKKVQEGDAAREAEVLRDQAQQFIAAQQSRLDALKRESVEIENNLNLVSDAETSAALDFHNQLASTQILLGIETGDATYRLQRLQEFLSKNF